MKKIFVWAIRIIVLVLIVKVVMWSWGQFQQGGRNSQAGEVRDVDKVCKITNPDTGQCFCVHRETRDRLKVPYDECVALSRRP